MPSAAAFAKATPAAAGAARLLRANVTRAATAMDAGGDGLNGAHEPVPDAEDNGPREGDTRRHAPAGQWHARDRGLNAGAESRGDRVNGAHEPIPDAEHSGLHEGDARRGRRGQAPADQRDARDRGLNGGTEPGGDRVNGAHEAIPDADRSGLREADARRSRRGQAPADQRDARDRGLEGGTEPGGDRVNGAHEAIPDADRSGLREGDARRSRRRHVPADQRDAHDRGLNTGAEPGGNRMNAAHQPVASAQCRGLREGNARRGRRGHVPADQRDAHDHAVAAGTEPGPREPARACDEAPRAIDAPPGKPAEAHREPAQDEDRRKGDGAGGP